jgi:hydroxymethylbilane synthase
MKLSNSFLIKVGARGSDLSRKQVEEISSLYRICFDMTWIETKGDLDRDTSLKNLDSSSDFFTKELDELVLEKKIDLAIHSAKDLPKPLKIGLAVLHLSPCIDSRDSLVFNRLPKMPLVATSSYRREQAVLDLCPDARFTDVRGKIHERLEHVYSNRVDAVVIAEAAIIRLGLTHLRRIYLPGETAEGQGQIAVVCREEDVDSFKRFF